jgi:P-type E1-E2 ATPase
MKRMNKVCMSVGDGGNDVPMISMAHVGVGIMGNEGMQAARASDFALGEFRMLIRLLAVHGRYSALRSSELIKYSFYKNLCFATPQVPTASIISMLSSVPSNPTCVARERPSLPPLSLVSSPI